tara:strand:- start:438 stop:902 length:465 start_codon:yes stop_codon:yes gene_type:complete
MASSRSKGRRGGNKSAPSRPAAVSGPGKLSRRTDGLISQEDVRGMVNESSGEESELVNIAREGNAAVEGSETTAQPMPQSAQPIQAVDPGVADIFGPSNENLPLRPGRVDEDTFLEPDDVMLIRAMAEVNPTPELIGLLQFASNRSVGRNNTTL